MFPMDDLVRQEIATAAGGLVGQAVDPARRVDQVALRWLRFER